MQETELDKAWNAVFKEYGILTAVSNHGSVIVTAEQLKRYREPRLLVKHDHDYDRPEIFKKHYLSILPITRGSYVIGHMSLYLPLNINWEDLSGIEEIEQPASLSSYDFGKISSEAVAINSAFASGILSRFLASEHLVPAGANGRMSSGEFVFTTANMLSPNERYQIHVNSAQMEIDASYEDETSLYIIEAKNSISHDILIRQLYYPYRFWKSRTWKRVRPIFLFYHEQVYHLLELEFTDADNYNSLRLVRHRKYRITQSSITAIAARASRNQVTDKMPVPFPQADSMDKIIDICQFVASQGKDVPNFDITYHLANLYGRFTSRQTDYYTNAAIYLSLLRKTSPGHYRLTDDGQRVFGQQLSKLAMARELAYNVLVHSIFQEYYQIRKKQQPENPTETIVKIMKRHPECMITASLSQRRAQTVKSWIEWIIENTK